LNCLTLLKVSEIDFDESPVNRTEMIKRVLFLLFNSDDIPTYKASPDLKDCEYVLGYFCETMLREKNYYFSRETFLSLLENFCKDRFIDLEIEVVFDVLHSNNIIVKRDNLFCFRFAYWIHYFVAQRMHHDECFARFIFEDMRYAVFPEVVEFYTDIDRRREDALQVLIKDLRSLNAKVNNNLGLPEGLNPYKSGEWKASESMLKQMQDEITNGVLSSNLPISVKDKYVDRTYDRTRPYYQDIKDILSEFYFVNITHTMRAGAKALRNSDYVNPDIKRQLLQEIIRCWELSSRVLFVLLPFLAYCGRAVSEGVIFLLSDTFADDPENRFNQILTSIPQNVVSWCKDDLFSQKLGPLLIDQMLKEEDPLKKHELVLLLIKQRPRGWYEQVHRYIASISKNSFYLVDVYSALRGQYRYSYASPLVLKEIEYLIKMAMAKHLTGHKMPGRKLTKKIHDSILPRRDVDQNV
jgi:hypothetical protein